MASFSPTRGNSGSFDPEGTVSLPLTATRPSPPTAYSSVS